MCSFALTAQTLLCMPHMKIGTIRTAPPPPLRSCKPLIAKLRNTAIQTFFLLAALVALNGYRAIAANWYVDNAASGGAHNGTNWDNAWSDMTKVVWGANGVKA